MQDRTLYARLLGIEDPWEVTEVTLRLAEEQAVVVRVAMDPSRALQCPRCQAPCSRYDCRERRWRHLHTMQYRTLLVAEVPRVRCDDAGESCDTQADANSAAAALLTGFTKGGISWSVRTHVVSIGGASANANGIAAAGGTTAALGATTDTELMTALNTIVGGVQPSLFFDREVRHRLQQRSGKEAAIRRRGHAAGGVGPYALHAAGRRSFLQV